MAYKYKNIKLFGLVSLFDGISNFVAYLMLKLVGCLGFMAYQTL